jgi:hypothetical protein
MQALSDAVDKIEVFCEYKKGRVVGSFTLSSLEHSTF